MKSNALPVTPTSFEKPIKGFQAFRSLTVLSFFNLTLIILMMSFGFIHCAQAAILTGATQIGTGENHSCALVGGGVKCWGANTNGQLGDNTGVGKNTAVDVFGLTSGVSAIGVGGDHTCAVMSDGSVKCWGWNSAGQLGDSTTISKTSPVIVGGSLTGVTAVTLGVWHTCALINNDTVKCWGDNSVGQLGNGAAPTNSLTPVTVSGLSGVSAIAAGAQHTCALSSTGVYCWGTGANGRIGDNNAANANTPRSVTGLGTGVASQLTVKGWHACARIISDGSIRCWGSDDNGQIGNDAPLADQITPVLASGLTGVTTMGNGVSHSCAIMGGGVRCWGRNGNGQLGDGTTTAKTVPPASNIAGLTGVTAVTGGFSHTCTLISGTGEAKCFGLNSSGQLGDNTTAQRTTPVNVLIFPEMDVQGNAISIIDGDTSPSLTDNTDFGNVPVGSPVGKTFTIVNTGPGPLTITTPITLSGTGCSKFGVTAPTSPVSASGGTVNFTITYTPNAVTTDTCTVIITNDDPNESSYDFVISGTGSSSSVCSTQVQIPAAECNALLDLYNSTGGPTWSDSPGNGWNVTTTPCTDWAGVTCGGGHVTQITRNTKNLVGTLPTTLSNLTGLTLLDLSYNQLNGSIPTLPVGLISLSLLGNQLSSSIPSLPASLTTIDLGYNAFTGETGGTATAEDPDWANTQTVAPTNVTVSTTADSVTLSWAPILYTANNGGYEVLYSTTLGGPYGSSGGMTADKLASSLTVSGLTSGTTYYFVVRTITNAHALNPNVLYSLFSMPEVTVTTPACFSSITVTTNADSGAGSLRQAIVDICADGVINFANPLTGGQTIILSSELTLNKNLTIQNTSGNSVSLSGNNATRVFDITAGTVNISTLTVANGNSGSGEGGSMLIAAGVNVILNDCIFQNNQAYNGGGAIANAGNLTVNRCTFSGNSVYVSAGSGGGGAISTHTGILTVNNSTFVNNSVPNGINPPGLRGGAIYTQGLAEIYNSTLTGNSVNPASADPGGAILDNGAGYVIVKNSILYGNTPDDCYGDTGNLPIPNVFVNNLAGIGCNPVTTADPLLGPLQNNGGATPTMAQCH